VLRALNDAGIDHGRELVETRTRSEYYELELSEYVDAVLWRHSSSRILI
jgi:hypothetical protein